MASRLQECRREKEKVKNEVTALLTKRRRRWMRRMPLCQGPQGQGTKADLELIGADLTPQGRVR